jgi:hypothetical protein
MEVFVQTDNNHNELEMIQPLIMQVIKVPFLSHCVVSRGKRMEDGMEDGGWRMEDGGWRMEDGGAKVV